MNPFFCVKCKPNYKKWLTISLLFIILLTVSMNIKAEEIETSRQGDNEETVRLEKIIVTSQKRPVYDMAVARSVAVITAEEIGKLPVSSVEDVIEYAQSVDVKKRGVRGLQSDISIRGASFEQVLVLIDGVKMNDSQTGHYHMDLPVSTDDIERIEVLRGGASALYGANAFGGVINIITRAADEQKFKVGLSRGEHNLSSQNLSMQVPFKNSFNRFSMERRESSGYRPDTDFESLAAYFKSVIDCEDIKFDFNAGFAGRDFGAADFYSNLYRQEQEHTDTRFFNLKTDIEKESFRITPLIYYRRHGDKFILDRSRPWWFVNFHTTYSYGTEICGEFDIGKNSLLVGFEAGNEKITSTNLGNHARAAAALFAMCNLKLREKAMLNIGLRQDYFQDWDGRVSPSVSANYFLKPEFKLRGAVNRLFRIPSYTELYYDSPANKGNENLTPEEGWAYEAGLDFIKDNFKFDTSLFLRDEDDVIDWSRESLTQAWQAQNISSMKTRGIELEAKLDTPDLKNKFFIDGLSCGYTYLYSTHKESAAFTKYSADYLKHQGRAGIDLSFPFDIRQALRLSYEERRRQRHYFLLSSKISKKMKKDKFIVEFFVTASNLLNTSYSKITDVAMPGRWIEGGVSVEF